MTDFVGPVAPTISGTSNARTTNTTVTKPFSGVTITDLNAGATDTLSITVPTGVSTGVLSGTGLVTVSPTLYTISGTAALITTELDALNFTSTGPAPGFVVPTTFALADVSSGTPSTPATGVQTLTNTVPTDSILFQGATGQNSIWQLQGTNLLGGGVANSNPGPDWTTIGFGNFYSTTGPAADFLLENTSTGQTSIWNMNGTNTVNGGIVTDAGTPVTQGTDWRAVGTGQFDATGTSSDILWQNVDGQASIWDMTANAITGGGQVSNSSGAAVNPGPGWTAVGTGDFNADGISDIVWQNTSTGAVSIWEMGGVGGTTVQSTSGPVTSGGATVTPGADWKAIGTGNFSGSVGPADDIIFQNTVTSQISVWDIGAGNTLTGGGTIATPGTGWTAVGTGGLTDAEILFQNKSGQTSLWDVAGTAITGGGPTSANHGPTWTAVGLAGSLPFIP